MATLDNFSEETRRTKAAVDKLLDERAFLLYGLPYDKLSPLSQDKVIAEAVCHFDPRLVDLADSMERP